MSLLRAPHVRAENLVDALVERSNRDGGWGASPGARSNAECTALAYIALGSFGPGGGERCRALRAGARWLLEQQQATGAWHYDSSGAAATWPTPLVLLALRGNPDAHAALEPGYAWLLATRGTRQPWRQRLREFITGRKVIELDSTLEGWPWTPGSFSWVEPTSWALLALKARWPERAPRAVRRRIRQGQRMLVDRECPGGGWNYGNGRVMGQDLEPYPDTTALALLGLRGWRSDAVARGFRALERLLEGPASGLSLALARLSERVWQRSSPGLAARWRSYLEDAAADLDLRTLALAAIASAPRLDAMGIGPDA